MLGSPRIPSPIPFPAGTPGRARKSGLRSRATQILALRFGWVVLVIWYEVGEFFHSLSTCRFPDSSLRRSHPTSPAPTHIVLLADPHVPHPRLSYPSGSRPWINWIKQQMDELFMRKSWNVVMRLGRVDQVVVLGDMLDWGRGVMTEQEYEDYIALYRSIFQLPPSTPMHFVPGNHDIPLGPNRLFSPLAKPRYAHHFDPPNSILSIANHTLVMLDAVGLVEEDYRRYAAEMQFGEWDGVEGGVIEFVKDLRDNPPLGPKILISHIPLARPERATCGPLREKGRISKGAGPGYQNLLGSETSNFLLDAIKPTVVFSGDDHDYCEYKHPGGIREVTVKSFSSSAGIRRPGLQLLSLVPPTTTTFTSAITPTHADRPCFLPDQLGVYSRVYLPLAVLTALYLLFTNLRASYRRWDSSRFGGSLSDLKARSSPALLNSDQIPNTASFSSRRHGPVPLNLPSRKSQINLSSASITSALPGNMPRPIRYNSTPVEFGNGGNAGFSPTVSTPGSPYISPRRSISDRNEETETEMGGMSGYGSPLVMSRRSSYIYMNSGHPDTSHIPTPTNTHSHNTLLPNPTPNSASLGPIRRVSSANLSALSSMPSTNGNGNGIGAQTTVNGIVPPPTPRRVTMPRLFATTPTASTPGSSAQKGFLYSTPPSPSHGHHSLSRRSPSAIFTLDWNVWYARFKSLLRWTRKARNGAMGKSWREFWSVCWVVGVVWILLNALFFLE